jgi:hypothetical protein
MGRGERRTVGAANRCDCGPALAATTWLTGRSDDEWASRCRLRSEALHRGWADLLGRIRWDVFATLTFDTKRSFSISREVADREVFWWCGYVGKVFRRPVGWAYAVERGDAGAWHAHALIVGCGDRQWRAPIATWEERCGFIRLTAVTEVNRIALYTSKSVARDGEVVLSDTLGRYRSALASATIVELHR